mmetsp:Transcript_91858/g.182484  ORF Transcript_91858/g.182484 Transcript_91858/m.182484 type:complete len:86 (+) Transcript_91858:183-440(+)
MSISFELLAPTGLWTCFEHERSIPCAFATPCPAFTMLVAIGGRTTNGGTVCLHPLFLGLAETLLGPLFTTVMLVGVHNALVALFA